VPLACPNSCKLLLTKLHLNFLSFRAERSEVEESVYEIAIAIFTNLSAAVEMTEYLDKILQAKTFLVIF